MVTRPVDRFDVYLVLLEPTVGSESQKTRPCLIISPDEMNHHIARQGKIMLQAVRELRRRHREERLLWLRGTKQSNLRHAGDCFAPSGEYHAGLRSQHLHPPAGAV